MTFKETGRVLLKVNGVHMDVKNATIHYSTKTGYTAEVLGQVYEVKPNPMKTFFIYNG